MRGAAPSIVCPRCDREAPPADAIGAFTLCLGCGMSFDASPRERLVPARKPKPQPEKPAKPRKPGHLNVWQIVGILVAVFALAYVKSEYFPSAEQRREQAELDQIQHDHAEAHRRTMRDLRAASLRLLESRGPECQRFATILGRAWTCDRPGAHDTLERYIDNLTIAGTIDDEACLLGIGELAGEAVALGCR